MPKAKKSKLNLPLPKIRKKERPDSGKMMPAPSPARTVTQPSMPTPSSPKEPATPAKPSEPSPPVTRPAPTEKPISPQLFVKLDQYKDILKNTQRLKSSALSLRDALDALNDIEKELRAGIEITQKTLDDFSTVLGLLDSKLLKPEYLEGDLKFNDVESYVKGVHEQLEKVRDELRAVRT